MQIEAPKERNLFFACQVDQKTILELSKAIVEINENDALLQESYLIHSLTYERKPIKIYIDSYGGLVYQILGLIGIIEKSVTPVHAIVTGVAASCGFLLLVSGHKKFGYEHSTTMYHQVSSTYDGKVQDLKEDLAEVERLQSLIEDITLRNTKIKPDKLKKMRARKFDWWMNAKESLKYGVINEII